jgi:tetratricopeptide (TPR) repeat protein
VVAACGYLPLAIRIAAARLAARRSWTVGILAGKLADERRRLHELQAGDLAVEATFELGYGQLEPAQARAFRLLGLPDGPDISLPAAAALLGLDEDETEDLLESLVDISLLEAPEPGRYRYQDLVRLYARACAERDELPPEQRETARSRLLDFYLATAARVYGLERPGDRTVDHLEPTDHPGLPFASRTEALNWLYAEAASILACVKQSLAHPDRLRKAVDLLVASRDLSESGTDSRGYEAATLAARVAAQEAGDARAEARACTALTQVHSAAGRFDEAERLASRGATLGEAANDPWTTCNTSNERGIVALCQGRYADAETHQRTAIEAFRADGNRPGEASALCNLGRALVAMDRTDQAVELIQQGMAIYDGMGLTLRLANARFALGIALAHADRHTEALEQFNDAVQVFHENRQRLWQGTTYFRISEVHLAAERHSQAAKFAEQALSNGFIGGDWMRANILTVLGKALVALSQQDRAQACWLEALSLYEASGSDEAVEVRNLLKPLAA